MTLLTKHKERARIFWQNYDGAQTRICASTLHSYGACEKSNRERNMALTYEFGWGKDFFLGKKLVENVGTWLDKWYIMVQICTTDAISVPKIKVFTLFSARILSITPWFRKISKITFMMREKIPISRKRSWWKPTNLGGTSCDRL